MAETFPLKHRTPEYTNEQLKDLLKQAYNAEIAKRARKLGRPLSEEERQEIKITREFMGSCHEAGILPSLTTFDHHFGSIIHVANLLGLPAGEANPRESYFESEKGEYVKAFKTYMKEFEEKNKRPATRQEIHDAVNRHEIPHMPTTIFQHFDVFGVLGIPVVRKGGPAK